MKPALFRQAWRLPMPERTAFVSPAVTITPEWEAFFVAILLDHGTRPDPELYGFERHNLEVEIGKVIDKHPACPPIMTKIKRSTLELGGAAPRSVHRSSDEWVYFSLKMAAAYLDWLYAAARLKAQRDAVG